MSDTYHYEDGAIHNDHKRVVHIDNISGKDLKQLLSSFLKDDVEEAQVIESVVEEPIRPGIFDERIFNSNERLKRLRNTIAAAIDMGEATIMYGQPQALRIDPTVQSEWYYILKPIEEAGITKNLTDAKFVEQMVEWYPMLFPDESPEYFKEFKRKLLRSISGERTRWRKGKTKDMVCLREMWAKGIATMLGDAKANRVWEIAYQGLYTSLTKLKYEIERENNLGSKAV